MNANNKIKNPNSRYQSLYEFTRQDCKELSNMFLTENSNTILVNSFYKTGKLRSSLTTFTNETLNEGDVGVAIAIKRYIKHILSQEDIKSVIISFRDKALAKAAYKR